MYRVYQTHLCDKVTAIVEQTRGKIQQKNRAHNLILSNIKSIVQTILL